MNFKDWYYIVIGIMGGMGGMISYDSLFGVQQDMITVITGAMFVGIYWGLQYYSEYFEPQFEKQFKDLIHV